MEQEDKKVEMPAVLSVALSENIEALRRFSYLPEADQQEVIRYTRFISTKAELTAYMTSLAKGIY